MDKPLSLELLNKLDAYWRAVNYLSIGQIYPYDNPLLREHVKPRLLGHWGTRVYCWVEEWKLKRRHLSETIGTMQN